VSGASAKGGARTLRGPTRADSLRPVLFGVVLLFVALLCAAGLKSYRDLSAARARERQLETRIEGTRGGIDRLRGRIERLRSDPAMLERLAREDLGLVRRQDVVVELPAPPAPPVSPAPPRAAPAPPAAPVPPLAAPAPPPPPSPPRRP
jgi:cell division protein FtsB